MNEPQPHETRTVGAARARAHLFLSKLARLSNRNELADASLEKAWKSTSSSDADTAFRFGNLALRRGETSKAIEAFTRAVEAAPQRYTSLYKLGFALERAQDWAAADFAYLRAQELSSGEGNIAFRRGRCLEQLGRYEEAVAQYHLAIRHGHRVVDAFASIYQAEKSSPIWKKLETLRSGTELHQNDFEWLRDRGVLAAKMGQHDEATEYLTAAAAIRPLSKKHRVELATSYHALGQTDVADSQLRELAASDEGVAKTLGPGAYFKERGHWAEAIALFERKWKESSSSPERARLEYEIAHAYDRQYLWNQAKDWFVRSLQTEGVHSYRHYRLGVVLERLGEFAAAYGPYGRALQLDPSKAHWWFRLGECAYKNGDIDLSLSAYQFSVQVPIGYGEQQSAEGDSDPEESAEAALLRMLSIDYISGLDQHRQEFRPTSIATWRESLDLARRYDDQAAEFAALVELNRRLGHLDHQDVAKFADMLVADAKRGEAVQVLQGTRDVRFPDGIDLKKYLSSKDARRRSLFAEFQKSLPINEKAIVLESNHGSSIGCHPLALFREMLRDTRFAGFTYVWAHSPSTPVPEEITTRTDVLLVEMHSDLYIKHLATAKYLINNVSFAPYFVRRDGQVYLNTWHGTPMKTLGQSMRQGVLEYENLARNFVQATHVSSPNDLTDWALFEDHRISRYATTARRITGSPRLDRLVNFGSQIRTNIREQLGVNENETLILYAPTWRGGVSDHEFDTKSLIEDLQTMTKVSGARIYFRAHRLTEKLVAEVPLPVDVVPTDIDTNDLLSAVDILVTDYSSIAFDYLSTGGSLVFYTPDIDEYKEARGLYLEPEDLPGMACRDRQSLFHALQSVDPIDRDKYEQALERFAPKEDGQAAHRTLDFMLETPLLRERTKPLVVFHASLIPNGIASALLALFHALDPEVIDIVIVVEGRVMAREEGRQSILQRLPDYVDLAFRIGNITATPEEQWAVNRDASHDVQVSEPLEELRRSAWYRETRRVIGDVVPATAIEFDGYATLWADFISNVGGENTRHLIWQHNQLVNEWRTKYPELALLFARYDQFDAIVPVADSLAEENNRALAEAGYQPGAEYIAVPNVLDTKRIITAADKSMDPDLGAWFDSKYTHVVSIGRLSPEKNFRALIDAWAKVIRVVPGARLTVLGEGLLMAELQTRIEELGLGGSVLLAGQRSNPYPILKRADLFVLPSVHEGQPVVVLEAMTLGVAVAAAYTPGTAELLEKGYGALIGEKAEGMATDIIALLQNRSRAEGMFDTAEFRREALARFERTALRTR